MQNARLQDYTVWFENSEEYHSVKREVWGKDGYYMDLDDYPEIDQTKLKILDAGAHIGLATLYWKRLYPLASVMAVEPHPETAAILRKNIEENFLTKVDVVEAALSDREGQQELFFDKSPERWYSTAGFTHGAWNGEQQSERVWVKTRRLSDLLREYEPDLVKLDIEGAEEMVLRQAQEQLKIAKIYLVEFHPIGGRGMDEIVKIFEEQGFEVESSKGGKVLPWHKVRGMAIIKAIRR